MFSTTFCTTFLVPYLSLFSGIDKIQQPDGYDYVNKILVPMFCILAISIMILVATELYFHFGTKKSLKSFRQLNDDELERAKDELLKFEHLNNL